MAKRPKIIKELWDIPLRRKPRKYSSPDELWEEASNYFLWCEEKGITDNRSRDIKGAGAKMPRAFTWAGLQIYCEIDSFRDYKTNYPEYSQVIARIEHVLYEQKFTGAASGVFKENIIARDLKLKDEGLEASTTINVKVDK